MNAARSTPPQRQAEIQTELAERERRDPSTRLGRRTFLGGIGLAAVAATALTAGQSFSPLNPINVFGPRNGSGAQGLPVNKTAASAEVEQTASNPSWQLQVTSGARRTFLSRTELLTLPQTDVELPIACVEGWSRSARWTGVRVRDLLAVVGAGAGVAVRVRSLQQRGAYIVTELGPEFASHPKTLLALALNSETLNLDHGFPARIIAPSRPGVLQTKWVSQLEVLG